MKGVSPVVVSMMLFSDSDILDGLGYGLLAAGLAGLIGLVISDDRRLRKRVLGVFLAGVAIGGAGLMWRAEAVRNADRDLSPEQQVHLGWAISQLPAVSFEVYAFRADKEAYSLALKIADAVKSATGVPPAEGELQSPQKGVTLVMRDDKTDLARSIINKVGRAFIAARIAVISDSTPELDDGTVRIVVGAKP